MRYCGNKQKSGEDCDWRRRSWGNKWNWVFVCLFVDMILGVLGCIDFAISLSKNLMWHVFIGWCKPKGLHFVLIEFNLLKIYIYSQLCYVHALYTIIQLEVIFYTIPKLKFSMYKSNTVMGPCSCFAHDNTVWSNNYMTRIIKKKKNIYIYDSKFKFHIFKSHCLVGPWNQIF